MKFAKISAILVAMVMVVSLSACGTPAAPAAAPAVTAAAETQAAAPTASAAKELVIGVTVQNMSDEFITMLKGAMELEIKKYPNAKLVINDAEAKPDKQVSQMDNFVSQKVNAIICNPADAEALIPAIEGAVKAGIPVITLSSDVSKNVGQFWSGSENESAGEIEAKYLVDKLNGKGNIAILRGPIGHFAEIGRFKGYKKVLDANPGIKVIYDQTGNWQREQAMSIMENWLQSGKQIDGVLAQNDGMVLGALKAITDAGKKGKIIVAGIDAIKDALDAVKAGDLDATTFQDAIGQAYGAVDMAVKAGNGEKIQPNIIPFELVTKDNVDKYYDRIKLPSK
jgi:inositol transport system substrate-binding protein